jgi:iron complex transport system substrate-binding protein
MSLKAFNRRRFVGLLAGTLLFAACGADPDTSKPATTEPAVAETTAPADTVAEEPADAKKMAGERIVSLSATATEMLYALGAQDQIVAVDNYSNYPQEAADFATKIDAFEPSVEAIAELDPTVVLLTYDPGDLQAQLEKLGIKVWIGAAAATLDDTYKQITELGDLTAKADAAAALVESMESEIEATITGMELPDAPVSYYYELDNTFYSLTSNTFIGQLMSRFMLQNIADTAESGNDYPQLSAESIISSNPQMIFLADTKCCEQTAATVAARAGWDVVDAVANGNVVELDDDIASRWGPRVVDLVKVVAEAVTKFVASAKGQ